MGWYGFMTIDVTQKGEWEVIMREISQTSTSTPDLSFDTRAYGMEFPDRSQAEKISHTTAERIGLPWIAYGQEFMIVGYVANPCSSKITSCLARVLKQDGTVVKTFENPNEEKMEMAMQKFLKKRHLQVLRYMEKVT